MYQKLDAGSVFTEHGCEEKETKDYLRKAGEERMKLMKKILAGFLAASMLLTPYSATASTAQPAQEGTLASMWADFENPPDNMKARPLWFWNTSVADMTVEQVEEIVEHSLGESGYYSMGILPMWQEDFMTEDYWEKYGAALDKAAEMGKKMTLYDENGFPSDTAGGFLAAQYPEHTAKRLDMISEDFEGPVQEASIQLPTEGQFMGAVLMNTDTNERMDVSDHATIVEVDDVLGASASSTYGLSAGYEADKAVDNDPETRWNSAAKDNQWLQINYGEPVTFDKVYIKEALDRVAEHTVQYWDGEAWIDVAHGQEIGEKTYTFEPVTASKVRIYFDNITVDSASIYEFQVFHGEEQLIPPAPLTSNVTVDIPEGNWKLMGFMCVKSGHNGMDYLDHDSVEKFIELTYEQYYAHFPEHFGTTFDTAFYDEPSFVGVTNSKMWTGKFNEKFEEKFGYNPITLYPALFMDIGDDTESARVALHTVRNDLFATEYIGQLNDWCTAHGLKLTGHMFLEETRNPTNKQGDLMKCFKYQEIPGVDIVFNYGYTQEAFKVISSSAYNWDHGLVMTESYGGMGEGMAIDDLYRVAMDQYAKGINFMIPHAVWYDNHGDVRYPPELSWRNPKFGPELPKYNEYVGRVQSLLQEGRHVADIAMLYPIYNLNGQYQFDAGDCNPTEADYMEISEQLSLRSMHDFTYLHPEVLDEKVTVDGDTLTLNNEVNWENYKVMIMPGAKIVSLSNLEKIKEFYDNGGKVIATTQLPIQSAEQGKDEEVRAIVKEIFGVDPLPEVAPDNKVKITASSTYSLSEGYEADKVGDGNLSTRWNAEIRTGGDQWLEVDFGEDVTFDRVRAMEEPTTAGRIKQYEIQYWDGENWIDVAEGGQMNGAFVEHTFEPVTTNKMRLYLSEVQDCASINEVEVYMGDSDLNLVSGLVNDTSDVITNENAAGGKAYYIPKDATEHLDEALDDAVSVYDVTFDEGIEVTNGNFAYIHKVKNNQDIYFIANSGSEDVSSYVEIRGEISPVLWDPHTGTKAKLESEVIDKDGMKVTRVKFDLPSHKSMFIMNEVMTPQDEAWQGLRKTLAEAKDMDQTGMIRGKIELNRAIAAAEVLDNTASIPELQTATDRLTAAMENITIFKDGNKALNAKVSTNSTNESGIWGASHLVDGDLTNGGWCSSVTETDPKAHAWVSLDLGTPQQFDKVVIYPRQDWDEKPFPGTFWLKVSNDGETWTTIKEVTDYPEVTSNDPIVYTFDEPLTYRYFMFEGTDLRPLPQTDPYVGLQLTELELYATNEVRPAEEREVILNATAGGTLTADQDIFLQGTDVNLTVAPDEGFELVSFTVNGEEVAPVNGVYTVPAAQENVEANAVFARLPVITAPSDVLANEAFTLTVNTPAEIEQVRLFNENDMALGIIECSSTLNEEGQKDWSIQTAIGTVGAGRVISVYGNAKNEPLEKIGEFTINVNSKAPVVQSVEIAESGKVNVPFAVKVTADTATNRVILYNEYGLQVTSSKIFTEVDGARVFEIPMKVGTAGTRRFEAVAVNAYGVKSEPVQTDEVIVSYF